MKTLNMVVLLLLLLSVDTMALIVEPPIIKKRFNKKGVIAETITIRNGGRVKRRYRVDIVGAENYEEWSLEDDIKVFPRIISIPPRTTKDIRLRVVKSNLDDGEYKSYLLIKELPIDVDNQVAGDEYALRSSVEVLTTYKLSIYGRYGRLDNNIITSWKDTGDEIELEINSIGNTGGLVKARIEGKDDNGKRRVEEIIVCRIMREEKAKIRIGKLFSHIEEVHLYVKDEEEE